MCTALLFVFQTDSGNNLLRAINMVPPSSSASSTGSPSQSYSISGTSSQSYSASASSTCSPSQSYSASGTASQTYSASGTASQTASLVVRPANGGSFEEFPGWVVAVAAVGGAVVALATVVVAGWLYLYYCQAKWPNQRPSAFMNDEDPSLDTKQLLVPPYRSVNET